MASMFWGLKMEPGKRYSTTVEKSFHVSMATLDPQSVKADEEIISIVLEEGGGGVFHLTNLRKKDHLFSNLDLNFMTGDKITLFCKGQGVIHLSGYMVQDEDDFSSTILDDEAEEEEEEMDDDIDESIMNSFQGNLSKNDKKAVGTKRKQESEKSKKAKKKKIELIGKPEDSDEESNDESDDEDGTNVLICEEDSDEEAEFEEEEDEDEEEEEDDEEEDEKILSKKQKNQQKTQANLQQQLNQKAKKKQNASTTPNKTPNGTASPQQKGNKDEGRKSVDGKGQQNQQQNKQQGLETTLTGGVKVKDTKVGTGKIIKPGKEVVVYYSGRLKSNGKVFDSNLKGSGFRFEVGSGKVIKGWDVGVVGMKVGGKRIITCPPQFAYGQKGAPPHIPPNSTLVFEVELKNVY